MGTGIGTEKIRIVDKNELVEKGEEISNFKWMLGIQIAMWITIISAILLH